MSEQAAHVQIALDDAQAGMILAAALCDPYGAVLLPCDTVLTEAVLASLRRRAITHCVVRGAAGVQHSVQKDARNSGPAAADQPRQMLRLAHLFRHLDADAGGALLLERLQHYRCKERV